MGRGYLTIDLKTNELRYVPPWPPRPTVGDLWELVGRRKTMTRLVTKVTIGRTTYVTEDGQERSCRSDDFWRWCRGAKLLKRKNKKVVYQAALVSRPVKEV